MFWCFDLFANDSSAFTGSAVFNVAMRTFVERRFESATFDVVERESVFHGSEERRVGHFRRFRIAKLSAHHMSLDKLKLKLKFVIFLTQSGKLSGWVHSVFIQFGNKIRHEILSFKLLETVLIKMKWNTTWNTPNCSNWSTLFRTNCDLSKTKRNNHY